MLRKVLAAFTGIVAAVLVIRAGEYLRNHLFPRPAGLDPADHEGMARFAAGLPAAALMVDLGGWAGGSLIAGMIVRFIARSRSKTPAYIAGLFLMSVGIVDIFLLPHPVWFIISGLLVFIPFALLGHWLGGLLVQDKPGA